MHVRIFATVLAACALAAPAHAVEVVRRFQFTIGGSDTRVAGTVVDGTFAYDFDAQPATAAGVPLAFSMSFNGASFDASNVRFLRQTPGPGTPAGQTAFTFYGVVPADSPTNPVALAPNVNDFFVTAVYQGTTYTGSGYFAGFPGATNTVAFGTGSNARTLEPQVTAAVPEPATWGTMLLGFGLVGAAARRRRGYSAASALIR